MLLVSERTSRLPACYLYELQHRSALCHLWHYLAWNKSW